MIEVRPTMSRVGALLSTVFLTIPVFLGMGGVASAELSRGIDQLGIASVGFMMSGLGLWAMFSALRVVFKPRVKIHVTFGRAQGAPTLRYFAGERLAEELRLDPSFKIRVFAYQEPNPHKHVKRTLFGVFIYPVKGDKFLLQSFQDQGAADTFVERLSEFVA